MAGEEPQGSPKSSGSKSDFAIPIFAVLILFMILPLLAGVSGILERNVGFNADFFSNITTGSILSSDTPLGTKIVSKAETSVKFAPDGAEVVVVEKGSKGVVTGGPVLEKDVLWWQVEYEEGTVGWVSEDDISIDAFANRKAVKEGTPRGTKVTLTEETDVRDFPGSSGVIATKRAGSQGTIVSTPTHVGGERWWKVEYEDGTIGWVQERDLEIDTERNLYAVTEDTLIGTKIFAIGDTDVHSSPSGFNLGSQLDGASGIIASGPAYLGERRWWDIDFEDEIDGWVKESSIEKSLVVVREVKNAWFYFRIVSWIITLILLVGITHRIMIIRDVRAEEIAHYNVPRTEERTAQEHEQTKWQQIMELVSSENPSDWRLAILEADIILNNMVSAMGYDGEDLGSKMKNIEQSDFATLEQAWEAHKVRNTIAHTGSDYILTQREARRVIDLYSQVFEEFQYI